jgi:hypothetical protein
MHLLFNFVAFQVGWFACVLGAAQQVPWIGPAVVLVVVAIHLRQAARPDLEAGLLVACGIIGLTFDSLLVTLGWVAYPSGMFSSSFAPYWIVSMWVLFGTTLNRSLVWLKGRQSLAAVLGAVSGPMSYFAGAKLGGIEFLEQAAALAFLAIGWGVIMPVLMILAGKLNGFAEPLLATESKQ